MKKSLEGWSSKNVKPEWSYQESIGFNFSIFKDKTLAIQSAGNENVVKVKITVETIK